MTQLTRREPVVETEFIRFLRRELPTHAHELMLFVVPRNGVFVVGTWINRGQGLVRELAPYPIESGPTRATVVRVKHRLCLDLEVAARRHAIEQLHRTEWNALDESEQWEEERIRRLRDSMPRRHLDASNPYLNLLS